MPRKRTAPPGEAKKDGPRFVVYVTDAKRKEYEDAAQQDGLKFGPWFQMLAERRSKRLQAGGKRYTELRARRDAIISQILELFSDLENEEMLEDVAATQRNPRDREEGGK